MNGTDKQNYGCELVACFDGRIAKITYDGPMSTKGNGITLQSEIINENGKQYLYQAVYWHLSEIVTPKSSYKQGEAIGYMGNSGLVTPSPSPFCLYCGTHVHFMLFVWESVNGTFVLLNADNGVQGAVDPLPFIANLQGEVGVDTSSEKDLAPFQYYIDQIKAKLVVLTIKVKQFLNL